VFPPPKKRIKKVVLLHGGREEGKRGGGGRAVYKSAAVFAVFVERGLGFVQLFLSSTI
jgi:hypothetical protein